MSVIKNIENIELEDNSVTITVNNGQLKSRVGSTAYIQVLDDTDLTSLTLTGTMDKDEDSMDVGAIKLSDFSGVTAITAEGLYMLPVDEFDTFTLTAEGSTEVIVKVIEN